MSFLKKVRFRAADLGDGEWVDLHLNMSDSFCPKNWAQHRPARIGSDGSPTSCD